MLQNTHDFKSVFFTQNWFTRSTLLCGAYVIWIACFRLVFLTVLTYFVVSPNSRFQDISDIFSSNEVSLMGLCALIFVGLTFSLFPLSGKKFSELLNQRHIEKGFLPGFWRGSVVAASVVAFLVLIGVYKYLGYFIPFEETPLALINIFLRMLALALLVYCEEYIFRDKIAAQLKNLPMLPAALWTAGLYCGVKVMQFDLGLMHLVTLFLISIALSYRSLREGQFARAAGYWAAILIIFHPLLSLPIFGNDFSGVLLIRYQALTGALGTASTQAQATLSQAQALSQTQTLALSTGPFSFSGNWARLLSGGAGGPISSFAFQLVLILDIARSILRARKTARKSSSR